MSHQARTRLDRLLTVSSQPSAHKSHLKNFRTFWNLPKEKLQVIFVCVEAALVMMGMTILATTIHTGNNIDHKK